MCESPDTTDRVIAIRTGDHNSFFIFKINPSTMLVDNANVSFEGAYMKDGKMKANASAKNGILCTQWTANPGGRRLSQM